ncbi:hypothetical protein PLANPX_1170 [Lacipirellula parvula]|uniref:Uncharacterized protein n=1 Tax=Lacipirellula parvula TaxID=2650471 RepID=A0A5K7X4T1_9BACT|nr:hypothetical protein PLANPX_1170 [Lacipirellula parvula]
MRFETTKVLVGSVPTQLSMMAAREVWVRPSPECESILYLSNRPDIGVDGFPIPSEGMRFDVTKSMDHNVTFYVAADNDYDDNLLHVLVRS